MYWGRRNDDPSHPQRASRLPILNLSQSRIPLTRGRVRLECDGGLWEYALGDIFYEGNLWLARMNVTRN